MTPTLGPLLGRGKVAEVFAFGDLALKLYRADFGKEPAFREAAILARVEALRLPAPLVHGVMEHEGRWGVLMTWAAGPTLADVGRSSPEMIAPILAKMAELHRQIHGCSGAGFRPAAERLAGNIATAPQLGGDLRERLLVKLRGMPPGDRLCHGDFHPMNVLGGLKTPVVVDWLDAQQGSPAYDVCRSYVLLRAVGEELAEAMLRESISLGGVSEEEVRAWLPLIAAARLAEDVPSEEAALLAMAAG